MRTRGITVSGADGTQQRLRYGLGERKPYRWHGIPDWNPATAITGYRSKHRKSRPCARCGARPGEQCRTQDGTPMARNSHRGR